MTVFAKRLKQARLRLKLTQENLGLEAGMETSSASARINQYEKGKHTPDFETAECLAKVLRVPAEFFYCRSETMAQLVLMFDLLDVHERQQALDTVRAMTGLHTKLP